MQEHRKQFKISDVGGHFGGSGDGVGIGIPDLPPGTPCLLEFKTHGDSSFTKLAQEGVRSAKFEHYVQMQMYMRKMGIAVALYGAVNKNDDTLHLEIVTLDTLIADPFIDRARVIILSKDAPKKINPSAGWFGCRFCDHKPVCHLGAEPTRNCRTCRYSEAVDDGTWVCNVPTQPDGGGAGVVLSKETQLKGCEFYEVRP